MAKPSEINLNINVNPKINTELTDIFSKLVEDPDAVNETSKTHQWVQIPATKALASMEPYDLTQSYLPTNKQFQAFCRAANAIGLQPAVRLINDHENLLFVTAVKAPVKTLIARSLGQTSWRYSIPDRGL